MKICFVVADIAEERAEYGTPRLAAAAIALDHEVYMAGVSDLTLSPSGEVIGRVAKLERESFQFSESAARDGAPVGGRLARTQRVQIDLRTMDAVMFRFNPGREGPKQGFTANPALDFGMRLKAAGKTVVSNPEGAQAAGGRMYLFALPPEVRPRTLVSRSPAEIKAFLHDLDAPAVIKPIADVEHAEEQVFYVPRGQNKNVNQMISVVRKSGHVLVQEYLHAAESGEERLLWVDGSPLTVNGRTAIYTRSHPGATEPAAHLSRRLHRRGRPAVIDAKVTRAIELITPMLCADGLFFVTIDLVDGRVLGINVHTPGGLHSSEALYQQDFSSEIIRRLELRVKADRAARPSCESASESR